MRHTQFYFHRSSARAKCICLPLSERTSPRIARLSIAQYPVGHVVHRTSFHVYYSPNTVPHSPLLQLRFCRSAFLTTQLAQPSILHFTYPAFCCIIFNLAFARAMDSSMQRSCIHIFYSLLWTGYLFIYLYVPRWDLLRKAANDRMYFWESEKARRREG